MTSKELFNQPFSTCYSSRQIMAMNRHVKTEGLRWRAVFVRRAVDAELNRLAGRGQNNEGARSEEPEA